MWSPTVSILTRGVAAPSKASHCTCTPDCIQPCLFKFMVLESSSSPALLVCPSMLELSCQHISMLVLFLPLRYKSSVDPFSAISCYPIFVFSALAKLCILFSMFPVGMFILSSHIPLGTHLLRFLLPPLH